MRPTIYMPSLSKQRQYTDVDLERRRRVNAILRSAEIDGNKERLGCVYKPVPRTLPADMLRRPTDPPRSSIGSKMYMTDADRAFLAATEPRTDAEDIADIGKFRPSIMLRPALVLPVLDFALAPAKPCACGLVEIHSSNQVNYWMTRQEVVRQVVDMLVRDGVVELKNAGARTPACACEEMARDTEVWAAYAQFLRQLSDDLISELPDQIKTITMLMERFVRELRDRVHGLVAQATARETAYRNQRFGVRPKFPIVMGGETADDPDAYDRRIMDHARAAVTDVLVKLDQTRVEAVRRSQADYDRHVSAPNLPVCKPSI